MDVNSDYAKQYWNLGNIITGFAAAQSLASIFYTASSERYSCLIIYNPYSALISTLFFVLLYSIAVYYSYRKEISFLPAEPHALKGGEFWTLIGRLATILIFNLFFMTIVASSSFLQPQPWKDLCFFEKHVPKDYWGF